MRRTVMLLLLFAAVGCGGNGVPDPALAAEGAVLFAGSKCGSCHGEDARGAIGGPSLHGIAEHYSVESMMTYLENPDVALEEDERLRERAEGYGAFMPRYDYLDEDTRRKLAHYVLSLQ